MNCLEEIGDTAFYKKRIACWSSIAVWFKVNGEKVEQSRSVKIL